MSKIPGKRENMKRSSLVLFALTVSILFSGCSFLWEPNDQEAVDLVESYYLFYQRGKEVDAEIIGRNKYDSDCKCFPIKFRVFVSDQDSFEKRFYFFKNATGQVEVRGSQFMM